MAILAHTNSFSNTKVGDDFVIYRYENVESRIKDLEEELESKIQKSATVINYP